MANPARGEADIVIAGKPYTVRASMGAIAEISDALEITSLRDFGTRVLEFRPRDMLPMAHALLKANGHSLSREEIDAAMTMTDWTAFVTSMVPLFFGDAKPAEDKAEARPPKRQKAAA